MKFMLTVAMPNEPFNSLVRNGKVGGILNRINDSIRPEATYFTEIDGKRTGVYIVNLQDVSEIPHYAEPFFLNFQAECRFRPVMTPEDLKKSGLDDLGKKWS